MREDPRSMPLKNPDGTPYTVPPECRLCYYDGLLILASPTSEPVVVGNDRIARPLAEVDSILPSVN